MKYVLILEDNSRVRTTLASALRRLGGDIRILEAETEEEAQRYLFKYRINVFVLDIVLTSQIQGDVSGLRFAEKVRKVEAYLFTPIIFITGLTDPALHAYRNLRSFSYLEKPFSMKEAVEVISLALRHPVLEMKTRTEYFRKDGILISVDLMKVTHVETCQHMLTIHTEERSLEIPYITLWRFLEISQMDEFMQCSRRSVINSNYISSIDFPRRYIQLKTGERVEIGPAFLKKLRRMTETSVH